MNITNEQIKLIVEETVRNLTTTAKDKNLREECWLCDTAEQAIASAKVAQQALMELTLEQRGRLIEAMRQAGRRHARRLAEMAVEETGYGRIEDKVKKNLLAVEKTPGIEDLPTYAKSGDFGLTIVECAPYGVIGSITPSTNPPSSVINNSISMISAGNAVVFNPHPAAKRVSIETMHILNEAIVSAGGPCALICTVREPTLESGRTIMEHPDVKLLSITGGEAVVNVAMRTGKKVIAAGPGNPPVIVDDSAIIAKAAKDIVDGASFDNNLLCIAEKEVFAFANIKDELMREMEKNGAVRIQDEDIDKVVRTVLEEKNGKYTINRNYVGRDASVILRASNVSYTGEPRLIIASVDEMHPFVTVEMLMPVLGIVSVQTIEEAVQKAVRAENGYHHTAMIHSQNISHLSMAAQAFDTTIFVKNAPSYAGLGFNGEGFASLTIATPTGEGVTSARSFTRSRRCVLSGNLRIV